MTTVTPPPPWTPPFFRCGECGGLIGRWPLTTILHQKILDWKHVEVPAGATPHRAILGTPGPRVIPTVESEPVVDPDAEPVDQEIAPDPVPPPEVPARLAAPGELPSSAASMRKLAIEHGWQTEAWYMRGTKMTAYWRVSRVVEDVVLRMRRDGHRLVAGWQTKADGTWAFELGFSLTHEQQPIGSPELRALIQAPRAVCNDCLESLACHPLVDGLPVCFTVLRDELTTLEAQ
jgi:hypothetical protein